MERKRLLHPQRRSNPLKKLPLLYRFLLILALVPLLCLPPPSPRWMAGTTGTTAHNPVARHASPHAADRLMELFRWLRGERGGGTVDEAGRQGRHPRDSAVPWVLAGVATGVAGTVAFNKARGDSPLPIPDVAPTQPLTAPPSPVPAQKEGEKGRHTKDTAFPWVLAGVATGVAGTVAFNKARGDSPSPIPDVVPTQPLTAPPSPVPAQKEGEKGRHTKDTAFPWVLAGVATGVAGTVAFNKAR
eukprot:CAMPEP_0167780430 /NCGR_PEP_ID=MMETSP0111_2-20121227/5354_1 /TAXON_ID=91324 /ORGANISM="Lotharella globosa, Strain CCCM811" /LENGTH=243 /DNA_ID=CAMNT_0007670943 /DNA_START=100 /DNA_END=828 /DNA_ORIENTATION=+